MKLDDLLKRRLVILSGKGGVGKTTMAVALGLLASRLKKKTLLIEMNSSERVAPFFGMKEIGYQEIPLAPFLTGINLNPKDCFEEYVIRQIRFKRLFDTFINNRFVTYFLNAIPGLNDLLMIGKIHDLERQLKSKFTREKRYDLLIVDAPATGHGVSAFEVPSVVLDAIHVGPLKSQAERILTLLNDTDKTAFSVVSLPEEMPVVESTELIHKVRRQLKMKLGPIFLNRRAASAFSKEEDEKMEGKMPGPEGGLYPYFAYSRLDYRRAELSDFYCGELKRKNENMEIIPIPELEREVKDAGDLKPIVNLLEGMM